MAILKTKRSTVAGVIPAASSIVLGELALNTEDGHLYAEKLDGTTVQRIGTTADRVKYTPAGTGEVSTNVHDKLRKYIDLEEHGVIANGSTDNTSVLNTLLATYKTLDIKGLNIAYSGNLVVPDGGGIISSTGTGKLTRTGTSRITKTDISVASTLTLVSNISNGGNKIMLSDASYAAVNVGDVIRISSVAQAWDAVYPLFESAPSSQLNDINDDVYKEQIVKVVSKNGSNTIGFDGSALGSYYTSFAVVEKLANFYNSVTISGITFVNSATAENTVVENCPINMIGVENLTVENCTFECNYRSAGIFFVYGSLNARNNTFRSPNNLAIFLIRAVSNSVIFGNVFKNQSGGDGALFISTSCYNINVTGNSFSGSYGNSVATGGNYVSAIDLSARSTGISVIGNTIDGFNVGVRLLFGSYKNVVANNTITNCDINAIYLGNAPYNKLSDNSIANCATRTAAQAAIHNITSNYTSVIGNTVTNTGSASQYVTSGSYETCSLNKFYNTSEILFNSRSGIFSQNEITYPVVGGYAFSISGDVQHYNTVDSNVITATNAITAIRIANGSECNTVFNNKIKLETGSLIALASTSNAQSITNNSHIKTSTDTIVYPVNVSIVAPVMPTNTYMPRKFRIYSTSTEASDPQGTSYWEYNLSDSSTTNHRFTACLLNVSSIVLP